MEYEAQPVVVRRVAKLIVQDQEFASRLQQGVHHKSSWLRDAAAIIFRFHSMCQDGELQLAPVQQQTLETAVEAILSPFERKSPVVLDPHYYGALYTQALVPWLCAWRSGTSTATLAALVRRTGVAIVHCYEALGKKADFRRRAPERMHLEYVHIAQEAVWRSARHDVVWNSFYA